MIAIVDYSVGNLSSIQNMLKKIRADSIITNKAQDLINADKLILPGVGHFDSGMQHLRRTGLIDILDNEVLIKKKPILGVCLGVQLLTQGSEEGKEKGLGWIKGKTVIFDKSRLGAIHKIPHMGWEDITNFENSKLFWGMYDEPRFYFVHSYHLQLDNAVDVLAYANYGYDFAVGIEHANILGVQFHPEKSHKFGMKLLENFVKYY